MKYVDIHKGPVEYTHVNLGTFEIPVKKEKKIKKKKWWQFWKWPPQKHGREI